jgi:predicted transposase YbfD/YdcC
MESLLAFLEEVPDPRAANARHDLSEILFVAVVATVCEAESCAEMAQFCRSKLDLLRRLVPLENGAPSHDTFSRVLRLLDPQAFAAAFAGFMAAFGAAARDTAEPGTLAVDGKSLRRAYDKGRAHMPPLIVTVFSYDTRLVLAQAAAREGGEAAAAIEALGLVALKGATVTADAIHCTRAMSAAVRKGGGDYVIALKGNQGRLARDAAQAVEAAATEPATPRATSADDGHGRRVRRSALVIPFRQAPGPKALVDLAAVAAISRSRTLDGRTTTTTTLYALSRLMTPDAVLRTVQDHWSIENNQHWSLDVLFREDEARTRKDNGPSNLAVLRRLALNILRTPADKLSLNLRRKKAAWEEAYLLSLLAQMR